MKFSIIIINYNTGFEARNCLMSIFNNCSYDDFEIILVDNDSTDGSIELLENEFKGKVKFLKAEVNKGFGAGNNFGAAHADGEYLFFLNSDTIVDNDFLQTVCGIFNKDDKLGILGLGQIDQDGKKQPHAFGKFPGFINLIKNKINKNYICPNNLIETDWVSGAAMITRKKIFMRVGGFDEKFFMYFEDADLCRRIKNSGYKIIYDPSIKIIHLGGKSINNFEQRKKYYYASQTYFYKKYYGFISMFILIFIRKIYLLKKM